METKTSQNCGCAKNTCGCAGPGSPNCSCGDRCACASACRCGSGCACGTAK